MISGEDILKAELRQPPLENKKNEPSQSVATSAWYWCLYLFILCMYLPFQSFVTGQKLFSNPICKRQLQQLNQDLPKSGMKVEYYLCIWIGFVDNIYLNIQNARKTFGYCRIGLDDDPGKHPGPWADHHHRCGKCALRVSYPHAVGHHDARYGSLYVICLPFNHLLHPFITILDGRQEHLRNHSSLCSEVSYWHC